MELLIDIVLTIGMVIAVLSFLASLAQGAAALSKMAELYGLGTLAQMQDFNVEQAARSFLEAQGIEVPDEQQPDERS